MNSKKISGKQFFLLSFLPALAYWYLEARYPLRLALIGGTLLATLEIIFEKIFTKHVHALSKFNFFLIVFLGMLSLGKEDGLWFKLQPCFTGFVIGGYFFRRLYKGKSFMLEMMESMGKSFPFPQVLEKFERRFAIFMMIYGIFMGGLALHASTGTWLFFKTIGFYITALVYTIFEIFYLRFCCKKRISFPKSPSGFDQLS